MSSASRKKLLRSSASASNNKADETPGAAMEARLAARRQPRWMRAQSADTKRKLPRHDDRTQMMRHLLEKSGTHK